MNQFNLKKTAGLIFILIFGLLATRCATPQKEIKEDRTYPLTEMNLENVFRENRGLKVLRENATMIHDVYRGGVQEKEEAERLMKDGKWEEARTHLEESNRYLRIVLRYLPEDEGYRNVYGDVMLIFLPNLLMADNALKLIAVYKNTNQNDKIPETKNEGERFLAESLKGVKTEWAYEVKKRFEGELPKK